MTNEKIKGDIKVNRLYGADSPFIIEPNNGTNKLTTKSAIAQNNSGTERRFRIIKGTVNTEITDKPPTDQKIVPGVMVLISNNA